MYTYYAPVCIDLFPRLDQSSGFLYEFPLTDVSRVFPVDIPRTKTRLYHNIILCCSMLYDTTYCILYTLRSSVYHVFYIVPYYTTLHYTTIYYAILLHDRSSDHVVFIQFFKRKIAFVFKDKEALERDIIIMIIVIVII